MNRSSYEDSGSYGYPGDRFLDDREDLGQYADYAEYQFVEPAPSGGLYGQDREFVHDPNLEYLEPTEGPGYLPPPSSLAAVCADVLNVTHTMGLDYGNDADSLIRSFVASLAAKPFVIFSGLAGAGKTQLASALGRWMGHGHYLLCPVRPDWLTPASVLGEENPNSQTVNSLHAWTVPRSLELMLEALRHPHEPFLLVFEEMNLAHVEQYFADVLSGMESGHPVIPNLTNDGSGWRLATSDKPYLPWPKNLYVIGTVNMDETTYKFSPKVLDRAACIEFRVPPGNLRTNYRHPGHLERTNSQVQDLFLQRTQTEAPAWESSEKMANALQALHHMLYDLDAEFGHRAYREALRFGALLADAGERDVRVALDYAMLYKVLPKYDNEDNPRKLVLQHLASFSLSGSAKNGPIDPLELTNELTPVLPRSFTKITRILRRLTYG